MREGGRRVEGGREREGLGWCAGTLTILGEFSGADLCAYEEGIFGAEDIRRHVLGCARLIDAGQCCVSVGTT